MVQTDLRPISSIEELLGFAAPECAMLHDADDCQHDSVGERVMQRLPLRGADGSAVRVSRAVHPMVAAILDELCPRWTPGGRLLCADGVRRLAFFDERSLKRLGVEVGDVGLLPSVVVYYEAKGWLVLIEAVPTHRPIGIKRRNELKELFIGSTAGLVFISAFEARKPMARYFPKIAWETEAWAAESPTHLIHFNGERFLGPYAG